MTGSGRRNRTIRPSALLDAMLAMESTAGSPADWLCELLRALASFLDHGRGVIGWMFRRDQQLMPLAPAAIHDGERFIEVAIRISAALGARALATVLSPDRSLETASDAHGLGRDLLRQPAYVEHAHPAGIEDFLALKTISLCGRVGVVIGAPLTRIASTSSYDQRPWRLLARHMSLGLVPRSNAGDENDPSSACAVFAGDGRLVHRATSSTDTERIAMLRQAVLAREQARLARTDPEHAIELLAGSSTRFALIDQFDSDGKRFVVACAPHRVTSPMDTLPPRLRQIAGLLANTGKNRKELACELGISPHTFDTEVKELYRRFQVRSRAEFAVRVRASGSG